MENLRTPDNIYLNNDSMYETILKVRKYTKPDLKEVNYGLTVEDGKNFFQYMKNFRLSKDPELLILPPNNHYYFDEKELRNVRTLINLKNLNLIKDLNSFLYTLVRMLPQNANFLGYFSYNKFSFTDSLLTGLSSRLNNLLDLKTDHNMDKKEITERFQRLGYKVVDMTEVNGLTFFYTKIVKHTTNFKA